SARRPAPGPPRLPAGRDDRQRSGSVALRGDQYAALEIDLEAHALPFADPLHEGVPALWRHHHQQKTAATGAAQLAANRPIADAAIIEIIDLPRSDAGRQAL